MRRLLLLLPAVCLVLGSAACSDDDGQGGDGKGDDPQSPAAHGVDPKEDRKKIARIEKCDAAVTTTGAFEAEWSGEATVRTGGRNPEEPGPVAVYNLTSNNDWVGLFSPGPDFKGSISVSADGFTYTSDPADAESFDIDERGKHAQVDTTLTSISGKKLTLVAEFTCGNGKAQ